MDGYKDNSGNGRGEQEESQDGVAFGEKWRYCWNININRSFDTGFDTRFDTTVPSLSVLGRQ